MICHIPECYAQLHGMKAADYSLGIGLLIGYVLSCIGFGVSIAWLVRIL